MTSQSVLKPEMTVLQLSLEFASQAGGDIHYHSSYNTLPVAWDNMFSAKYSGTTLGRPNPRQGYTFRWGQTTVCASLVYICYERERDYMLQPMTMA